ncbi:hypothetical protein [Flavilitoribacter nigricans]|uniref:Uncharacterized protein n=1 Tax=Flavilitoribacter nigricans (strain ATCC 23147 / DSM 23189 / NBRC 102662 / NCIMB 1420 / SS-2) TaxID=1122177 RepID=A0A2D0MYR9_FLAN2|nr:hypothetical protein [Flavilitoribacter nigricans]PHN01421.1 hypothetical protein CRP01_37175 [Flavilitoribacter nigricans DSM 23189 = NBRC 102662]
MSTVAEKDHLQICKAKIAEQLQLGSETGKLRSRDFEYLATSIEENSGIKISTSTLKRIWKKGYDKTPHPATLNALVSVLGYEDWPAFKQEVSDDDNDALPVIQEAKNYMPIVIPLILCSLLFLVVFDRNTQSALAKLITIERPVNIEGEILFTADKMVSTGVPNTVIFNYDVSDVEADSFFIQQSWNPRNKVRIDPTKNHFSTIYYTPGFHYARLIANTSIIKFQPVHIKSEDWLGIVKYDLRDNIPTYLPTDSISRNGKLQLNPELVSDLGIDTDRDFYVRYYQVRDFGSVPLSDFQLKTTMRIDSLRNTVCPLMEIMIVTEKDISYVQFTPKGCVANLDLRLGEQFRSARDADLSAFGTNVYDWQEIELRVEQQRGKIRLNKQEIGQIDFAEDYGQIVGVILTFKGLGAVDDFQLEAL